MHLMFDFELKIVSVKKQQFLLTKIVITAGFLRSK